MFRNYKYYRIKKVTQINIYLLISCNPPCHRSSSVRNTVKVVYYESSSYRSNEVD